MPAAGIAETRPSEDRESARSGRLSAIARSPARFPHAPARGADPSRRDPSQRMRPLAGHVIRARDLRREVIGIEVRNDCGMTTPIPTAERRGSEMQRICQSSGRSRISAYICGSRRSQVHFMRVVDEEHGEAHRIATAIRGWRNTLLSSLAPIRSCGGRDGTASIRVANDSFAVLMCLM